MNKLIAVTLVVVAIIFGFLWKHDDDARRDGMIALLDAQRVRDSAFVDSLATESVRRDSAAAVAVTVFAKRDTIWRRHSDTIAITVAQIVHDTIATDSARIERLAMIVLQTRLKANDAVIAAEAMRDSLAGLRVSFVVERAGWQKERATMTTEIDLLKRQSRRWGLVASFGYDPLDLNLHKPRLNVGVGLRY